MEASGVSPKVMVPPHTGAYTRRRPCPLRLPPKAGVLLRAPAPRSAPIPIPGKRVSMCLPADESGPSSRVLPHTPEAVIHPDPKGGPPRKDPLGAIPGVSVVFFLEEEGWAVGWPSRGRYDTESSAAAQKGDVGDFSRSPLPVQLREKRGALLGQAREWDAPLTG